MSKPQLSMEDEYKEIFGKIPMYVMRWSLTWQTVERIRDNTDDMGKRAWIGPPTDHAIFTRQIINATWRQRVSPPIREVTRTAFGIVEFSLHAQVGKSVPGGLPSSLCRQFVTFGVLAEIQKQYHLGDNVTQMDVVQGVKAAQLDPILMLLPHDEARRDRLVIGFDFVPVPMHCSAMYFHDIPTKFTAKLLSEQSVHLVKKTDDCWLAVAAPSFVTDGVQFETVKTPSDNGESKIESTPKLKSNQPWNHVMKFEQLYPNRAAFRAAADMQAVDEELASMALFDV